MPTVVSHTPIKNILESAHSSITHTYKHTQRVPTVVSHTHIQTHRECPQQYHTHTHKHTEGAHSSITHTHTNTLRECSHWYHTHIQTQRVPTVVSARVLPSPADYARLTFWKVISFPNIPWQMTVKLILEKFYPMRSRATCEARLKKTTALKILLVIRFTM